MYGEEGSTDVFLQVQLGEVLAGYGLWEASASWIRVCRKSQSRDPKKGGSAYHGIFWSVLPKLAGRACRVS